MGLPLQNNNQSAVRQCLEQNEYTKPEDLKRSKDMDVMNVQGLLIGDRILPVALKDSLLWTNLATFYYFRSRYHYFKIRACDAILKYEMTGQIPVGTMLIAIHNYVKSSDFSETDTRIAQMNFKHLFTYVKSYKNAIRLASAQSVAKRLKEIRNFLGDLLIAAILYTGNLEEETCISQLHCIADLVGVVNEVAVRAKVNIEQPLMIKIILRMSCLSTEFSTGITFRLAMLSNFLLLQHEDPSYQSTDSHDRGETILHCLIKYVVLYTNVRDLRKNEIGDVIDQVLPVVRRAIRRGCCVALRDKDGRTALELAQGLKYKVADEPENYARYKTLLRILNNSPVELTLQELAARIIIQNKISYSGKISDIVCKFIGE